MSTTVPAETAVSSPIASTGRQRQGMPRSLSDEVGQSPKEVHVPNARLLYVGMTRAQDCLLVTASRDNRYSRELVGLVEH